MTIRLLETIIDLLDNSLHDTFSTNPYVDNIGQYISGNVFDLNSVIPSPFRYVVKIYPDRLVMESEYSSIYDIDSTDQDDLLGISYREKLKSIAETLGVADIDNFNEIISKMTKDLLALKKS